MTLEEKELLIKDLSERLLFGVKIKIGEHSDYKLIGIVITDEHPIKVEVIENGIPYKIEVSLDIIKPYLRSMSSMTGEEREIVCSMNELSNVELNDRIKFCSTYMQNYTIETFDYLKSIHIDYRGFIEKGLALEALKGMYN